MGEPPLAGEYESWLSTLFPSHDLGQVVVLSATVSVGLFGIGYVVAAVGRLPYLNLPEGYLGAFTVFWLLAWLGVADAYYVDVWRDVRSAFAVDDERYHAVVDPHLSAIHDTRRILGYTAALVVPYVLIVCALYVPGSPVREPAVELFLGGDSDYAPSLAAVLVLSMLGSANAVLIATIINGFVNHLALVRDVATLPFRDVHATAMELEPVVGVTVASATVWFAGLSLVVLWVYAGISGTVGLVIIAVLVFVGLVFFLAPQLILHDALVDAKRTELAELRAEYRQIHQQLTSRGGSPADVELQLELTDRRLENANAIRTWVYNLSSIGKLAAAAVIPGLTLVQEVVTTAELLLGA